jgi:hypothetical protein
LAFAHDRVAQGADAGDLDVDRSPGFPRIAGSSSTVEGDVIIYAAIAT